MYRNLDTHPRKTHVTRAATTVTAATFCVTMLGAPAVAGQAEAPTTAGEAPFSRTCFMVQAHWNTALDGTQPLCPGPALSTNERVGHPHESVALATSWVGGLTRR